MQGDIYTAPPNILNYLGARCFIGGTCVATGFCNGGCLLSVAVTRRPVGPWLPYAVGGDVIQHACAVLVHGIVSTAHPGHRRACLCSWRKLKCGIRVQVYPDRREHVISPRRAVDAVHVHTLLGIAVAFTPLGPAGPDTQFVGVACARLCPRTEDGGAHIWTRISCRRGELTLLYIVAYRNLKCLIEIVWYESRGSSSVSDATRRDHIGTSDHVYSAFPVQDAPGKDNLVTTFQQERSKILHYDKITGTKLTHTSLVRSQK